MRSVSKSKRKRGRHARRVSQTQGDEKKSGDICLFMASGLDWKGCPSLVPQGFDWVQPRGFPGGIEAEGDADANGNRHGGKDH